MKNQVHLITYIDRLTGGNIKSVQNLLVNEWQGVLGGVHLLPFYYPIDGADAGFDPIDHTQVDPRLGSWEDISSLSKVTDIMADVIVNHVSAKSQQFLDFLKHREKSPYADMFITFNKVFDKDAKEEELSAIYRPRPGSPFTKIQFSDGSEKSLWTTFTANQIDIDVKSNAGKDYLLSILKQFKKAGIKMIRLDAAGYAIKKRGTSCFMIPETFDFIGWFSRQAKSFGMEVLVEIHSFYKKQIEIAKKVDWVYDFALSPLILHSIFSRSANYLKQWLAISPRNAITILDTHDGIGVIDVGRSDGQEGLLPDTDIEALVRQIHQNSQGQSEQATGSAASNLDLYQVNCTYFDALGRNEKHYLLARAIQFFAPGIPQVYYMGLLAEPNDMQLLAKTKVGRDINRHYFTGHELEEAQKRQVVIKLFKLIKFRNSHPAFNGKFKMEPTPNDKLIINWHNKDQWAKLEADLKSLDFNIKFNLDNKEQQLTL